MASFVELVRAASRESGTISDITAPQTVAGQSGRMQRFVYWTAQAWRDIQNLRDDWRWMRGRFEGSLLPGVQEYAYSDLGIARFASWVYVDDETTPLTIYPDAEGQASERPLRRVEWDAFYQHYLSGENASRSDKPGCYAVTPEDKLAFWPTPDAAYTVRGQYQKGPQELAADDDVPEMPVRHHDMIWYRALLLMSQYDEAFAQFPGWQMEYERHMAALERAQTPRVKIGGALA